MINIFMSSRSELEIKKFISSISTKNYVEAYNALKGVLYEKVKKRCSTEYDCIKHLSNSNK